MQNSSDHRLRAMESKKQQLGINGKTVKQCSEHILVYLMRKLTQSRQQHLFPFLLNSSQQNRDVTKRDQMFKQKHRVKLPLLQIRMYFYCVQSFGATREMK